MPVRGELDVPARSGYGCTFRLMRSAGFFRCDQGCFGLYARLPLPCGWDGEDSAGFEVADSYERGLKNGIEQCGLRGLQHYEGTDGIEQIDEIVGEAGSPFDGASVVERGTARIWSR